MERIITLAVASVYGIVWSAEPRTVDYTRDIKPLLADRCYACHGPDAAQRKAGLRLDVREGAVPRVIQPGAAETSKILRRLSSSEPDEIMPPPSSKKPPFTPAQIELIRRWIKEGAPFEQHWAYVKPQRPAIPVVRGSWPRNVIDRFIAAEHQRRGLQPAPEADRVTLIRRLSFDLLGMPPSAEQVERFVGDTRPDAFERLVDEFLASPHFGERLAMWWLDLVRYADTAGYHSDNHRDVTPYRDYVIHAFNSNMRFDQFTIEQLAGDLLPQATIAQRIASGYNRLLQTTEEGGAQPKEYTAKYAADRVRNLSSVWLATTMGCCECHDHKFDPFDMKDFYRLAAFFADVQEVAVGRQPQTLLPSPDQAAQLSALDQKIATLKAKLEAPNPDFDQEREQWEKDYLLASTKPKVPKAVAEALAIPAEKRTEAQKRAIVDHVRSVAPSLAPIRQELAEVQKQRDALVRTIPSSLVTMSGPPRTVRILPRGNWLDDSGPIVTPDVPTLLSPRLGKDNPSRLDLARWLTHPDHPLTARVFVNRFWKLLFGQGLVRSLEDFGSQGQPPTHPDLLDWLAREFIDSGWNVKHMLRLLATSATYRQSSRITHSADPANTWWTRQNRFRLDAEIVRDTALALAGMLSRRVGGPSIKPYQPPGYWSFLNFPVREWEKDRDERQYRRGLYTYWCRTFLHPALLAFDAPSREECTVERPKSSTPLQALVLLNDPNFVEASRVFAQRLLQFDGDDRRRLEAAYRIAVSRPPSEAELQLLMALLQRHRDEYAADRNAAEKILGIGDWPRLTSVAPAELAAWTSIARVLLNMHETYSRY
jgi:hypothetical protein